VDAVAVDGERGVAEGQHVDRCYVTEVEGYPGLIVHGPQITTLLLDLLRRQLPDARVTRFTFRAMKPVFDVAPPEGQLTIDAGAILA
jgi:hydroxyacyl-ACP dehydratase HTD2-like protein with hotdog domain